MNNMTQQEIQERSYTLYKLPERFILTSDEWITNDYVGLYYSKYYNSIKESKGISIGHSSDVKIIAQQDQIDFSSLSEEEQKEIGYFDVNKLAEQNGYPETSQFYDYKEGFIDGFKEAQELLSDRRFTLKDIHKAITMAKIAKTPDGLIYMDVWISSGYEGAEPVCSEEKIVQSLSQPKLWNVEIQHVCEGIKKEGESCTLNNNCKYPNCGKIKITKIL